MRSSDFLFVFSGFLAGLVVRVACGMGACPDGWVEMGHGCLLFQNTVPLPWTQASDQCRSQAATLLRFRSQVDRTGLATLTQAMTVDGWWTDLTQIGHTGIWTWGENEEVFNDELLWATEPDDTKHLQNCVAFNVLGKFSDDMCSRKHGFVCERPNPGEAVGCGEWLGGDNTACYYPSDNGDPTQLMSWQNAKSFCANQNSSLLSVDSIDELTFVTSVLSFTDVTDHRWWTGINDIQQEGQYVNTNNQPVNPGVVQWDQAPNNLSSTELCGLTDRAGQMTPAHCDQPYPYICLLEESADSVAIAQQLGCPGLWLRAGRKCYYFGTQSTVIQQDARQFCQHHGGDLLKVQSLDEMKWLTLQTERIKISNFWTGLSRSAPNQDKWSWVDGSPTDVTLIKWNQEPNDYAGSEDCAVIGQDGVYNDVSCFNKAGYICELYTDVEACPGSWITRADMDSAACYYISNTTDAAAATWWEAQQLCKTLAGTLPGVSLFAPTDQEEQEYVTQQIRSLPPTTFSWWTDLTDMAVEGVWQFANPQDGQADPSIIVWAGEPNNADGHEDCAVIYYGGRYNDVNCQAKSNVACERSATITSSAPCLAADIAKWMTAAFTLVMFTWSRF